MLKYIIPLLIIYFIYIYNKPFLIHDINDNQQNINADNQNNKYINMLIEKNMFIFLTSIVSSLIIWTNKKEDIVFIIALILINLAVWIRVMKYNKYNTFNNQLATNESFISSVRKPMYDAYINEKSRKQFEADFLNECYDKKILLTDFEPITKPEAVLKEDVEIREATIDLALNSDDMFSVQQAENKCIIANYIPDNLEIISNNLIETMSNNIFTKN
jgi:hypothetical protein